MKFDKTTVIGLIICAVLLFAWEPVCRYFGWLPELPQEEVSKQQTADEEKSVEEEKENSSAADAESGKAEEKAATETSAPAAEAVDAEKEAVAPAAEVVEGKEETAEAEKDNAAAAAEKLPVDETIGNDSVTLTVSAKNGSITGICFLKFKHDDRENNIEISGCSLFDLAIPEAELIGNTVFSEKSDNSVTVSNLIRTKDGDLSLSRTYTVKDDYVIDCRMTLKNCGEKEISVKGAVLKGGFIAPWHTFSGDKVRTMSHRLDYLTADGEHEDIDADEDDEDYFLSSPPEVLWFSVNNKYFCSILKRAGNKPFELWQERPRATVTDKHDKEYNVLTAGAVLPEITLAPGKSSEFEFSSYTGPKSSEVLSEFVPDGEDSLHLAWGPLNLLARFLMWLLNFFYSVCGSYGISIILLTLLVRTAFYPLTSKGNESMRKMQKVQPLFKELKEKYKNDPQLLNQKMTELYRKEGINPLAGCLPVLLQIPIFFALYAMLDNAIALRHVSFLWAKNLAAADTVCTIPLGFTDLPLNPLVIAMTVLMVIQQRMTPMSADPVQKKMMMFMPIVMLVFLYDLPSGLTLYWTVSNLFSIVQLWLQKRRNQALEAAAAEQGK